MAKEIYINVKANETRIAISEEGHLTDFFIEHEDAQRSVGDIYLGKIAKVLPGIKAAFIEIGKTQDAFLHFSDVSERKEEFNALIGDPDAELDTNEDDEDENTKSQQKPKHFSDSLEIPLSRRDIGQNIIVQIIKEPIGNKGFRVTSRVSLPGRFLVLLPFDRRIGISKKINEQRLRNRLRKIVKSLLPEGFGVIIRTVAEKEEEKTIADDLNSLLKTWQEIEQLVKTEKAPSLIYKDLSTTSSVIRDLFTKDVNKIIIDNKKLLRQIKNYLQLVQPELVSRIEHYKGGEPIFDVFGVERQIDIAFARKVPLPSGGSIVIEITEAMTVVDVNSGKYAASMNQEVNSLKTDLEAAREISCQIKLRDIGGIIVIDFIDLDDERNRKKVHEELKKEFKKDKAKYTILPMTEFGLVQITRQRVRKSAFHLTREKCPYCDGTGQLVIAEHIFNSIERWVRRFRIGKFLPTVTLKVNPYIYKELVEGIFPKILKLQLKYRTIIKLKSDKSLRSDEYKFFTLTENKEINIE